MRSRSAAKKKQLKDPVEVGKHMVVDPRVCFGQLIFKGTRVPVEAVLVPLVLKGRTIEEILAAWPELKREAIAEAIQLAAAAWPELLREEVEKKIKRLAASLAKENTANAKATGEPAHSGAYIH